VPASISTELRDRICQIVNGALVPTEDDTLTRIEIKEMADCSGNWVVFVEVLDLMQNEITYRSVINQTGDTVEGPNQFVKVPIPNQVLKAF